MLSACDSAQYISDDIVAHGRTKSEHDERLQKHAWQTQGGKPDTQLTKM